MIVLMHRALVCCFVMGSMVSCFDEGPASVDDGPADSSEGDSGTTPTTSTTVATTEPMTGTSADSTSSSSSDDGEPSTTSESTTGDPPMCGDGTMDDGEECDDGNVLDADGCNSDCRPSGRYLWGHVEGDFDEDVGNGITVAPNGDVFATGLLFVGGIHDDVWLGSWTPDGDVRFATSVAFGDGSSEHGADITINGDGLVVAVVGSDGGGLLRVNPDDAETMPVTVLSGEEAVEFTPRAVTPSANGFYFAGSDATDPRTPALLRVSQFFAPVWAIDEPQGPGNVADYTGVAVGELGAAVACGISGLEGFVHSRAVSDGALQWTVPELPPLRGIAVSGDGEIVVVGTSFSGATQRDLWVGRLSPGGEDMLWERDIDGGEAIDDRGAGVAIDADGNVTAAGNGPGGNALVSKLSPDGDVLWTVTGGFVQLDASLDVMDVAVSPEGDVSIVGAAFGNNGDGDIFVAHFAR